MALRAPFPLLLGTLLLFWHSAAATFKSVPELERAMYQPVEGTACVRLLTVSGEIGCGNPYRAKVVAPIVKILNASEDLENKAAVLLPFSELSSFLKRTLSESVFAQKVAGLLVESVPDLDNTRALWGVSDDEKFPQAEFAPYTDTSYVWNPPGSGIIEQHYNFPVYLLSENGTRTLQQVALENQNRNLKYPLKVVDFDIVMQTTKVGSRTSDACLQEWSCLPLGGYSVWSSLPPINASASSEKPIVLAVSSMDSASFFRDSTIGADSPLSGMIALLAAADALSKTTDSKKWKKQLLFIVFTGEAWGYLGSRRFLSELSSGGSSVQGLNSSLIDQILEVGSVGRAVENTFYAHGLESQVIAALQDAASSFVTENETKIEMKLASTANPGIPPSSLMSFQHQNKSIAGVVLTEFDTSFSNQFYHSGFDIEGQINISSVVSAASLVARTLYLLANDNSTSTSTDLDKIVANRSLIEQLVGCLLTCDPGMSCSLVNSFITPVQVCPNHYVGVFLGDPSTQPVLGNIDDTARFVWNFLANRTASAVSDPYNTGVASECSTDCPESEQVCVGSTVEHKGTCVVSTTRYVPAYSTRLQYGSTGWLVVPAASGDKMGEVDPIFTESYWKSLEVKVYTTENSFFDCLILAFGVAITVGSFFTILSVKALLRKRLKRA